jgi:AraC family transcriptional regulator
MAERPIVFASEGRFEIVSHASDPTEYAEETHAMIQICVPMVGARYRVMRETGTGASVVHDLAARDVLLVPAGQPHAVDWLRPAGIVSLQISESFVEETLDIPRISLPDASVLRDSFVTAAARELYVSMRDGEGVSPIFAEALAVGIAYRVTVAASRQKVRGPERPRGLTLRQLHRVERYIDENLDRQIGLGDLADVTGLSRWYFLRRFHETVGTSPHDYITRARLDRAMDLLRTTRSSVMKIAAEVGMTHSHFSRLFARRIGMTPSDFRRDRHDDEKPA